MQSRTPLFADFADLMTDAFSAAQAAGEEARAVFRAQAERMAGELDLVSREEFEALRARADAADAQIESLMARLAALEAAAQPKPAARKPAAKRSAAKKSN
ncbi:accessory factor UbiK family protein [Alkalicaulis satelles]|uniref:Accessory factor UbiK family protein n=1 Tax=Alkalicaulis satelles TaxID=2609175 RepID=A0A5M6ZA47_9PROT|nr:accessory factor UbiK family protein [Alkalicaulis satelles]KAA5801566.1 accessory factor UbiK family protein [Alkalicaulis satelles]